MKKTILTLLFIYLLLPASIHAQVAISSTNVQPDPSAMLDIRSSAKGLLIPRMTTTKRTSIANPANGLLVYDSTTANYSFFKTGKGWTPISSFNLPYRDTLRSSNYLLDLTNDSTGGGLSLGVNNKSSTASVLQVNTNSEEGRAAVFNATSTGFAVGVNAVEIRYAENTNLYVYPGPAFGEEQTANGLYVKTGPGTDFSSGPSGSWGVASAAVNGNSANKIGVYGSSNNNAAIYGFTRIGSAISGSVVSDGGNGLIISYNGGAASTNYSNNLAVFTSDGANVARIDNTGKGYFNGGTVSSGADVAELFAVEKAIESYEAGDVLEISTDTDRTVRKSTEPYSTLVAGVYATKPGVVLTEENTTSSFAGKVPMGVIGVIPTKVCLENGRIKRGDILVTSSTTGVAMKADPDKVKTGQAIGKALQDYNASVVGKINVLVSIR